MAAGLPVVAESGEAIREVVEHGHTGLLFEDRDLEGASRHLAHLHDDRDFAAHLGATARDRVLESHHIDGYRGKLSLIHERIGR